MQSILVKNLKSISDSGNIAIKPITIFVGANSSGKSSLLRIFPLLKQTFENRLREPLLWNGGYVDFGSFKDVLADNTNADSMTLGFTFKSIRMPRPFHGNKHDFKIEIGLSKAQVGGLSYVSSINLTIDDDDKITISIGQNHQIVSLNVNKTDIFVNQRDLISTESGRLLPFIIAKNEVEKRPGFLVRPYWRYPSMGYLFEKRLISLINSKFSKKSGFESKQDTINSINYVPRSEFREHLAQRQVAGTTFRRSILSTACTSDDNLNEVRDVWLSGTLNFLFLLFNEILCANAKNIEYVTPLRIIADRFYRLQGLAVDTIDPLGRNLAVFIDNLSKEKHDRFTNWTMEHLGFSVRANQDMRHITLEITEDSSGIYHNLIDAGFGYSQILPIAIQLWHSSERQKVNYRINARNQWPENAQLKIVAMEQPELHLHPTLQAKLAEAFVSSIERAKANNIELRLVIETHSETIINRIGYQIRNRAIDSNDVNIVLFEKKPSSAVTSVREVRYDDKGYLVDWPYGFFLPKED
ncbi:AAA family ATPase [Desulfarculus baarsii]